MLPNKSDTQNKRTILRIIVGENKGKQHEIGYKNFLDFKNSFKTDKKETLIKAPAHENNPVMRNDITIIQKFFI